MLFVARGWRETLIFLVHYLFIISKNEMYLEHNKNPLNFIELSVSNFILWCSFWLWGKNVFSIGKRRFCARLQIVVRFFFAGKPLLEISHKQKGETLEVKPLNPCNKSRKIFCKEVEKLSPTLLFQFIKDFCFPQFGNKIFFFFCRKKPFVGSFSLFHVIGCETTLKSFSTCYNAVFF